MRRVAVIPIVALAWVSVAQAADPAKDQKAFINKAAQVGMLEVELGKLAQEKAEGENVKYFGERMVKDHKAANEKLKGVAEQVGAPFPDALDAKHRKTVDELSKLSGEAFDKRYMSMMVKDHEKDVKLFEKVAKSSMDEPVKTFAKETLTALHAHLSMARSIKAGTFERED